MSNPKDKKPSLAHQDWEPVTLTRKITYKEAEKKGRLETVTKSTTGNKQTKTDLNAAKLDRTELGSLPTITLELAQTIIKARNELKLSQDDLAKKSGVPLATLKKYEQHTSKIVVESKVLNQLSKVLKVPLKKPVPPKVQEEPKKL